MKTAAVIVVMMLLVVGVSIADDAGDFEVVKGPTCSNDSADVTFSLGVTGLLGKLMAETPKHKAKDGGGYSYSANTDLGNGQGTASCVKGKNDVACGACLSDAMGRLTGKCSGKTSGSVQLKICQMSFNKS